MAPTSPATPSTTERDARYWLVIHGGQIHQIEWDDGERLLALSTEVREGRAAPQAFRFRPRTRLGTLEDVSVFVDRDTPIQLLNQSAQSRRTQLSHWFG